MNEADLWILLGQYNSYGMTAMALYVTVASSYLAAAYLVGAKLTRYEVLVVSGLFVIFAALITYGTVGYFLRAVYFTTLMTTYTESLVRMRPAMPLVIGAMEIFGIGACLKFMWDARHSKGGN